MESYYKPPVENVGMRESGSGILKDNKNNPEIANSIKNNRIIRSEANNLKTSKDNTVDYNNKTVISEKSLGKGVEPEKYYTIRAKADNLSYESQKVAETGNNFKLSSELRYHEVPEEGGVTVIGAGQNPKRGAYNIDINPSPEKGIFYGDANNLDSIASNSQSKVIIENPFKFDPFKNNEIPRILKPEGTLKVTGIKQNKYFYEGYKNIKEGSIPEGFSKILKIGEISEDLRIQGFRGDGGLGDPIKKATDLEIQLRK